MPEIDLSKKRDTLLDQYPHAGAREARAHFSRLMQRAKEGKPTLITKHGELVAAFVPVAWLRVLDLLKEKRKNEFTPS